MRKPRRITQADYRAAGRGLARDMLESRRYLTINRYDCRSTLHTVKITARNCSAICDDDHETDGTEELS
jgi:hypothetical protein